MAPPPVIHGKKMPDSWWEAAKRGAARHNTDPFRVAAVAWIESGGWKAGRLGRSKYVGPCGFNSRCKIPDEVMYVPENQIEHACRLLKGDFVRRLKRYNPEWRKDGYVRSVTRLHRQLEREARESILCQW
jgi:hypothetical protein